MTMKYYDISFAIIKDDMNKKMEKAWEKYKAAEIINPIFNGANCPRWDYDIDIDDITITFKNDMYVLCNNIDKDTDIVKPL